jgi:hypothetical protein
MSGSVRGVPGDRYPYRDCRDCIAKVIKNRNCYKNYHDLCYLLLYLNLYFY